MTRPAYIALHESGELRKRAAEAVASLASCRVCPRDCKVDRLADKEAVCRTGRYAQVASHFAHFGEEDCLRGTRGSGTIFFSMCNLRCVFCQNYDISQARKGAEVTPEELAALMIELQNQGCHNINFVTPEHVVPQIIEALPHAIDRGLNIPLVYNTSAYDSLESLQWLDGIIDIYMPDFKFWDSKTALLYVKAKDYTEAARAAIKEMHRQVGDLVLDENGLARRGLMIRHLVMPGGIAGTREIMKFIADEISSETYVNVMAQYYPAGTVDSDKYAEINRGITQEEYQEALATARKAGLNRLDPRRGLSRSF
ncbi:MAG: radical SAM protein [Cyanobacteria bacterium HKST-UBA02]|nr:radical SAM protein [Cyanobacteria bacterium HKST-UBA02]